jgi:hypothetical protein
MVHLKAMLALRMGFACWATLCITVGCNFQWGLFGPFDFSGLAITFLLTLLHAHPIILINSPCALHLVKLALVVDFMASVVLALGGIVYFVSELGFEPLALSSSMLLVIASAGACVRLAHVLEGLSATT